MARLRSGNAPTPATRRSILREKTNTTATPAPAVETSMLALKNFKRRPRQGSMLEMVRKRRSSVQQSLVNVQPQEDVENTSVFDLGSASEGEDDFAPEAEGTPVQLSKTVQKPASTRKSTSARKSTATAAPATRRNKRKSDELETSHSALDALRRKHRKSEVPPVEDEPLPQVEDEHQSVIHPTSERDDNPLPNAATSDVQVINSSPVSTPPTEPSSSRRDDEVQGADFAVPSTEEQERRQQATRLDSHGDHEDVEDEDDLDTPNATMAEPVSSSPVASPLHIPETQRTDIYADPLTQASPPPPESSRTRSQGKNKKPTAVSTATLRALLPKRTQRPKPRSRRTEYDISSDDDEDDDTATFETTHLSDNEDELGGRLRRRQTKASAPSKGKKKPAAKSKPAPSTARSKPTAPQPQAKSKAKGKGKAKGKPVRTYGRSANSDKENESGSEQEEGDGVDTSMSMRDVAHSKEMEEARRKFAEVDDWDLSFESMSNEDHRSSSQNWR